MCNAFLVSAWNWNTATSTHIPLFKGSHVAKLNVSEWSREYTLTTGKGHWGKEKNVSEQCNLPHSFTVSWALPTQEEYMIPEKKKRKSSSFSWGCRHSQRNVSCVEREMRKVEKDNGIFLYHGDYHLHDSYPNKEEICSSLSRWAFQHLAQWLAQRGYPKNVC